MLTLVYLLHLYAVVSVKSVLPRVSHFYICLLRVACLILADKKVLHFTR